MAGNILNVWKWNITVWKPRTANAQRLDVIRHHFSFRRRQGEGGGTQDRLGRRVISLSSLVHRYPTEYKCSCTIENFSRTLYAWYVLYQVRCNVGGELRHATKKETLMIIIISSSFQTSVGSTLSFQSILYPLTTQERNLP